MNVRTQITLDSEMQSRARRKAADLGISFAEYIRRVVARDLDPQEQVQADVRTVFALGDSGGSDVAADKDRMLGAAVARRR